ncbi:hypothetical protein [Prauserella flavalba]|uniref:hypothetical protein n=1 Tax=Prauserella flavalba TaxID=1477506 RepID=UPI0036EE3DD6
MLGEAADVHGTTPETATRSVANLAVRPQIRVDAEADESLDRTERASRDKAEAVGRLGEDGSCYVCITGPGAFALPWALVRRPSRRGFLSPDWWQTPRLREAPAKLEEAEVGLDQTIANAKQLERQVPRDGTVATGHRADRGARPRPDRAEGAARAAERIDRGDLSWNDIAAGRFLDDPQVRNALEGGVEGMSQAYTMIQEGYELDDIIEPGGPPIATAARATPVAARRRSGGRRPLRRLDHEARPTARPVLEDCPPLCSEGHLACVERSEGGLHCRRVDAEAQYSPCTRLSGSPPWT